MIQHSQIFLLSFCNIKHFDKSYFAIIKNALNTTSFQQHKTDYTTFILLWSDICSYRLLMNNVIKHTRHPVISLSKKIIHIHRTQTNISAQTHTLYYFHTYTCCLYHPPLLLPVCHTRTPPPPCPSPSISQLCWHMMTHPHPHWHSQGGHLHSQHICAVSCRGSNSS